LPARPDLHQQRLREDLHVTRVVALPLAIAMLVAGSAACGRSTLDDQADTPGDASMRDAGLDASAHGARAPHVEASVADSFVGADQGAPTDSAAQDSPSRDAAEGPDANAEASTSDASGANDADAADASEASVPYSACDECERGSQQCGPEGPGQTIWTCVVGDAGCAVWDEGQACRPDVPCCVPCTYEFNCPLGGLGDPCQQDTDCAFNACDAVSDECVSDQCGDHRQDGQESDVDCGGQICNGCWPGQRCQSNFDCVAGHPCGASHRCE
jgi:hypothetical protein